MAVKRIRDGNVAALLKLRRQLLNTRKRSCRIRDGNVAALLKHLLSSLVLLDLFLHPRRKRRGPIEAGTTSGSISQRPKRIRDGNVAALLKLDSGRVCFEPVKLHPRRKRRGPIEAAQIAVEPLRRAQPHPRRKRRGPIEASASTSHSLTRSSIRDGNVAALLKLPPLPDADRLRRASATETSRPY